MTTEEKLLAFLNENLVVLKSIFSEIHNLSRKIDSTNEELKTLREEIGGIKEWLQ